MLHGSFVSKKFLNPCKIENGQRHNIDERIIGRFSGRAGASPENDGGGCADLQIFVGLQKMMTGC